MAMAEVASPLLEPYVDPLPLPPVIHLHAGVDTNISMTEFYQKLHRDLPATRLWGYNSTFPGPTLEAWSGHPVCVTWYNRLPLRHFLPIDPTLHGAEEAVPPVRTVVHLHGMRNMPDDDGFPEAWFTSDGKTGPTFRSRTQTYLNDQAAATLWYHDHALGITRLNIYAGLSGMYLLRDRQEGALNLPKHNYEIPLIIQDRLFNPDGSLLYPMAEEGTHPIWIPEFFGDTVLVNGKVWPYLEVEPRRYRFRILNGSNARFYHLSLVQSDAVGRPTREPGPVLWQIGSDGGLLPAPVPLKEVLIAPAERMDIVIDFSGQDGATFVFRNDAVAPYPSGGEGVPEQVMMFRVSKTLQQPDRSSLPNQLRSPVTLSPQEAVHHRRLSLVEYDRDPDGAPITALLDNKMWDDPVSENPKVGTVEIWEFLNTTEDAHPIHVHLVQFQVLDRRLFDVDQFLADGTVRYLEPAMLPETNEQGARKDTVKVYPHTSVRIIAKFDLPVGADMTPGQHYRYVWHCHMLEHEDNEMMRPFDVLT
jgi:spore coat protein A, manganese oxidase